MEKRYPELLEEYVKFHFSYHVSDGMYLFALKECLNLDNLLTFLLENKDEWEWVECPHGMICLTGMSGKPFKDCETCDRGGKIKHPALQYLEGL